jgi:murein DD-endopeptidase MepM/ murein hydrolase activator NlpD
MNKFVAAIIASMVLAPGSTIAEVELKGRFVQGGMIVGQTQPGAEAYLDGREIRVGNDGRFVFGFPWNAKPAATLELALPNGARETRKLSITKQEYRIERVDGLPPKTVTIPDEERQRRLRERTLVAEARALNSDLHDWLSGFRRPAEGRISGVYGSHRILNGEPRSPHFGLDIAGPISTPIVAPAGGVITLAEGDFLLEGGIIVIDHGFGVSSTLFHMQTVEVEKGQYVKAGQRVGSIGATGRASGPHVDWRVNWFDMRLDPAQLLEPVE